MQFAPSEFLHWMLQDTLLCLLVDHQQLGMCKQVRAQELTFLGRAASSSGRFLARLKVPLTYSSTCTTSC